ncbi:MAG: hypothetical protein M1835_005403 [Candelina submexicana]|nr:MAG: hypothetical protein M1835_005403 [Candelina submexicana]
MGKSSGTQKSKNRSKLEQKQQISNNPIEVERDQSIEPQQEDVENEGSGQGHIHNQSKKLQRLRNKPPDARIQKRPMLRPPIVSPYAGKQAQKVVYISSKTPFVSAVKRTRKLLNQIDKRSMGKVNLLGKGKDRDKIVQTGRVEKGEPEEVVLKATGKAIEKALGLALFFQGQEDCKVKIRTGSIMVVDDIIEVPGPKSKVSGVLEKEAAAGQKRKRPSDDIDGKATGDSVIGKQTEGEPDPEATSTDEEAKGAEDEIPETQMRQTSMIEIAVTQSIR